MTPEGKVKARVKAALVRRGIYHFMPVSNGMGRMGVADIICCVAGRFVGIECKSDPTKKPTPLQVRNAEMTVRNGGIAILAHSGNILELEAILDQIIGGAYGTDRAKIWAAISDSPHTDDREA